MAKKRKVESDSESEAEEVKLQTEEEEEDEPQPEEPHNDDDDDDDDLTKLLEPFTKEQLIELLKAFASTDPNLSDEIHRVADSDPAQRKLFVHGLGWETTSETLRDFYSQYGEIEECNVVADKVTAKSKGYGFLSFKHRKSAQRALKEPQKQIESRMTACQLASAGPVSGALQPQQHQVGTHHPGQNVGSENLQRKIYVGNVHSEISPERLHAFFSKYGEVEEGPLGFDKQTGRAKGYALFIYKTLEGARKALEEPSKTFEGHLLYCQRATDNKKEKAAAASTAKTTTAQASGGGYVLPGAGYNVQNGGMALQGSVANPALYGQGMLAGAQQFGAGVAPIQAALAVLAAAGHNPGAFGVSPAAYASLNPAMMAPGMQGYGMANPGFLNPQGHQAIPYPSGSVGQASAGRPHSMRPMGGYLGR